MHSANSPIATILDRVALDHFITDVSVMFGSAFPSLAPRKKRSTSAVDATIPFPNKRVQSSIVGQHVGTYTATCAQTTIAPNDTSSDYGPVDFENFSPFVDDTPPQALVSSAQSSSAQGSSAWSSSAQGSSAQGSSVQALSV